MKKRELTEARPASADSELIRLVDALGHWWPGKRKAAENAIRQRGAEIVDPLLTLFEQEGKRRARGERVLKRATVAVVSAAHLFTAAAIIAAGGWHNDTLFVLAITVGVPVTIVVAIFLALSHNSPRQTTAAVALSLLDDVGAVGPLCEMLEFQDTSFLSVLHPRPRAVSALKRLLPLLREEHSELPDSKQRACLMRALGNGHADAEMIVLVLYAYRFVGTGQELPTVRRFAEKRNWSEAGRRIGEAARDCLPDLERRAEEEKHAQTLLRPSQASAGLASDVLLRAASGGTDSAPEQLLRPSGNGAPPERNSDQRTTSGSNDTGEPRLITNRAASGPE